MKTHKLRSAEEVMMGHPDHVADAIAERILHHAEHECDSPSAKVEVSIQGGRIHIWGMIAIPAWVIGDRAKACHMALRPTIKNRIIPEVLEECLVVGSWAPERVRPVINMRIKRTRDATELILREANDMVMGHGFATYNPVTNHMPVEMHVARVVRDALNDLAREHPNRIGPYGKVQVILREGQHGEMEWERLGIVIQYTNAFHPGRLAPFVSRRLRSTLAAFGEPFPFLAHGWEDALHINPHGATTFAGIKADSGHSGGKLHRNYYGCGHPTGAPFVGKSHHSADRATALLARQVAVRLAIATRSLDVHTRVAILPQEREPSHISATVDGVYLSGLEIAKVISMPITLIDLAADDYRSAQGDSMPPSLPVDFFGQESAWER